MHIEFDMQVKKVDRQLNVEDCSWEGGDLGWRLCTVLPVFFCTLLLHFMLEKVIYVVVCATVYLFCSIDFHCMNKL